MRTVDNATRGFTFTGIRKKLLETYSDVPTCFKCVSIKDDSLPSDFLTTSYADGFDVHAVTSSRACVNCPDDDELEQCSCLAEACDTMDADLVDLPHCSTTEMDYDDADLPDRSPPIRRRRSRCAIYDRGIPFIWRSDHHGGYPHRGHYYRDGSGWKSQVRFVKFRPPRAGRFVVYAWWTAGEDRSRNVPFEVHGRGGGFWRYFFSQRTGANEWHKISPARDFDLDDDDSPQGLLIRTKGTSGYVSFNSVRYCERISFGEPAKSETPAGTVAGVSVVAVVAIVGIGFMFAKRKTLSRSLSTIYSSGSTEAVTMEVELSEDSLNGPMGLPTTAPSRLQDVHRLYGIMDASLRRSRSNELDMGPDLVAPPADLDMDLDINVPLATATATAAGAASAGSAGPLAPSSSTATVTPDPQGNRKMHLSKVQEIYEDMGLVDEMMEL